MNSNQKKLLIRGLAGEIGLAALLTVLVIVLLGYDYFNGKYQSTAGDWRYVMGLLFTISVTFWFVLVNWTSTDFGIFLRSKNVDDVLNVAMLSSVIVFFASTCSFVVWTANKSSAVGNWCLFVGILSITEFLFMALNLNNLRRLHSEFRYRLQLEQNSKN